MYNRCHAIMPYLQEPKQNRAGSGAYKSVNKIRVLPLYYPNPIILMLTEPELPVKVAEAHFVVLPAAHEVLLGLDVVADLEDDPAAALGLEVAVDPPRPLRQVRWVDEVDARLAGALRRLDVVARETHVVRP